jgi:Chaperone of endosialidase
MNPILRNFFRVAEEFSKLRPGKSGEELNERTNQMKTITNIIYPAIALFALACFGLSPAVRAVTPAPDGGYPNGNTAEGQNALFSLTTGYNNVAVGYEALFSNTSGVLNTGSGYRALYANATGNANTATGNGALRNTTAGYNTADGLHALFLNTTGKRNTGVGAEVLSANTFGSSNIALGYNAGSSLTTGNDNIDIGNVGIAGESGVLRIGTPHKQNAAYVAGIYGATEANGLTVFIGSDGHLGTVPSSARFKDEVKPMDEASEALIKLKPVTFRYTKQIDPDSIPQFGLIAEEVENVNPDLVVRDKEGKPFGVRYDAVNAMLLNEFIKEHRKNEKQEATIARLEKQIEVLTVGLQKVSAQLELSKSAPQTVLNNQ